VGLKPGTHPGAYEILVVSLCATSVLSFSGGTGDEAEKMQIGASREAICWGFEGWREAA